MTLGKFYDLMYTNNRTELPCSQTIFRVFDSEDAWDKYHEAEAVEPCLTIGSYYRLNAVLLPEYAQAEVLFFSVPAQDIIEVVVEKTK